MLLRLRSLYGDLLNETLIVSRQRGAEEAALVDICYNTPSFSIALF